VSALFTVVSNTCGGSIAAGANCQQPFSLYLWRSITVALLVTGYAGYYLCRSDLSVALPLISADLASNGVDATTAQVRLGAIASLGVLAESSCGTLGIFTPAATGDPIRPTRTHLGHGCVLPHELHFT
jgi:hypothetical protein